MRVSLGPLDGVRHEHVQAHLVLLGLRLAVARELDDVAHERGHLVELAVHVAHSLRRLSSGSGPGRSSTSKFVRRLVSGVRSSCDASATSWRWAATACSSAASMVLKLAGEPAQLIASGDVDAAGEVVRLGDVLGRPPSACAPAAAPSRATNAPSSAASATPPAATSRNHQRSFARTTSASLRRRAIWTENPGADRHGRDPQVDALHRHVVQDAVEACVVGRVERLLRHRQRRCPRKYVGC